MVSKIIKTSSPNELKGTYCIPMHISDSVEIQELLKDLNIKGKGLSQVKQRTIALSSIIGALQHDPD